ncbi:MAG: redoxin domain-containing protein [Proteobacteria bacterium]|nr:redoxin domain-containing protein [Pseudomonadota bacterium]
MVALPSEALAAMPLRQLDGRALDLAQTVRGHDATVLVWWATRCPCVARYQQRIEALGRSFPPERVALLAIASNADDDLATVAREVRRRGMHTSVVLDPRGQLAQAFGARTTPSTIVLNRRGQVVFHGWIDNEREPGVAGRQPHARRAIAATLAGRTPNERTTPVYGCLITKRIGETQSCLPAPEAETCHAAHDED